MPCHIARDYTGINVYVMSYCDIIAIGNILPTSKCQWQSLQNLQGIVIYIEKHVPPTAIWFVIYITVSLQRWQVVTFQQSYKLWMLHIWFCILRTCTLFVCQMLIKLVVWIIKLIVGRWVSNKILVLLFQPADNWKHLLTVFGRGGG